MNLSVIKACKLLDLFTYEEQEWSLAEIARKVGDSKPTVYRLLSSLEACGLLIKVRHSEQDIRYRLGLKLLELGNRVREGLELRKIALSHMQKLGAEIDEVVHLVVLEGQDAVYIEKVESRQNLRLYTRIGQRAPLYAGSGPRLLLAYLPEEERQTIIDQLELRPLTAYTITDRQQLIAELLHIRSQGYAVSYGEQDANTIGLSYPIYNDAGEVVAALGVSGLALRFTEERIAIMKTLTQQATAAISEGLGYPFMAKVE